MRAIAIATEILAANLVDKTYKCPLCGTISHVTAPVNEWLDLHDKLVQNAMPSLKPHQRETVISGMCFGCQKRIFNVED